MRYTVRAGSLAGYEHLVEKFGGNPASLLRAAGLSPVLSRAPEIHIPYPVLADLYSRTARVLGQPDFGLILGENQGLEVFGALGSAACLQPDMNGALGMMQRSLGFHARGVNFDINPSVDKVALELRFDFEDSVDCDQLAAVSIALAASAVRQLRGGKTQPARIELSQSRPDGLHPIWVHGCKVCFDGKSNAVYYGPDFLDLPVEIDELSRESLDEAWQSSAVGDRDLDLETRLKEAIESLLPTGECQLPLVASLVGKSPRALQMQLAKRQTSFESILQKSRERLAKSHLQRGNMSVTELALNLSYSDTTAFSRAFRSWTGVSPRNWRNMPGHER